MLFWFTCLRNPNIELKEGYNVYVSCVYDRNESACEKSALREANNFLVNEILDAAEMSIVNFTVIHVDSLLDYFYNLLNNQDILYSSMIIFAEEMNVSTEVYNNIVVYSPQTTGFSSPSIFLEKISVVLSEYDKSLNSYRCSNNIEIIPYSPSQTITVDLFIWEPGFTFPINVTATTLQIILPPDCGEVFFPSNIESTDVSIFIFGDMTIPDAASFVICNSIQFKNTIINATSISLGSASIYSYSDWPTPLFLYVYADYRIPALNTLIYPSYDTPYCIADEGADSMTSCPTALNPPPMPTNEPSKPTAQIILNQTNYESYLSDTSTRIFAIDGEQTIKSEHAMLFGELSYFLYSDAKKVTITVNSSQSELYVYHRSIVISDDFPILVDNAILMPTCIQETNQINVTTSLIWIHEDGADSIPDGTMNILCQSTFCIDQKKVKIEVYTDHVVINGVSYPIREGMQIKFYFYDKSPDVEFICKAESSAKLLADSIKMIVYFFAGGSAYFDESWTIDSGATIFIMDTIIHETAPIVTFANQNDAINFTFINTSSQYSDGSVNWRPIHVEENIEIKEPDVPSQTPKATLGPESTSAPEKALGKLEVASISVSAVIIALVVAYVIFYLVVRLKKKKKIEADFDFGEEEDSVEPTAIKCIYKRRKKNNAHNQVGQE